MTASRDLKDLRPGQSSTFPSQWSLMVDVELFARSSTRLFLTRFQSPVSSATAAEETSKVDGWTPQRIHTSILLVSE
jgi:hypothetical protein